MGLTGLHPTPPGPIQLQKNKEQEEQLGEMIQAYEKLCVEKSDLETELGEMVRPRELGAGECDPGCVSPCVCVLWSTPCCAPVVSESLFGDSCEWGCVSNRL